MRVYEEYTSSVNKKKAQRGAKRGKPTNHPHGYIFVFNENDMGNGKWEAMAGIFDHYHNPSNMTLTGVTPEYLRKNCRKVGRKHLPVEWKKYCTYLEKP